MSYQISYTVQVTHIVQGGLARTYMHTLGGSQYIPTDTPANADYTTATNAMAADILNQLNNNLPQMKLNSGINDAIGQPG